MPLGLSGRSLDTQLTALDVPIVVRCSGSRADELHEAVSAAWVDCLSDTPDASSLVVDAFLDGSTEAVSHATMQGMVSGTSLELVLDRLVPTVTVEAITHNAGKFLMLHACGLADLRTGATVALVAPSGTGKTTLARTLGQTFGYVSDETVAIRTDRSVIAYPKPLSVLGGPGATFKHQMPASALGLRPQPGTLRLTAVALLTRDPGASGVEVADLPTVQALGDLTPQISFLGAMKTPLQTVARLLRETGGLRQVRYRDSWDLEGFVSELIGAS